MTYTVGEVAKLARVSVRGLHHYDEIGIVKPSGRSAAGYRLYTDADLERLQQVLFFRELGFKLEAIASLLTDPSFDRKEALLAQRSMLERRLVQTRATLELVDKTLRALEGETTMTKEEMFEVFGELDVDKHEQEARERWGDTDAFRESAQRTKAYTKQDWLAIKAESERLTEDFAVAAESGVEPADAADIAERHRLHIDKWFYPCSKALHSGLGKLYVDDPRMSVYYETRKPGLAAYVRDAILANALR